MKKNYWLVKQEPETFSWEDFVKKGETLWDGVRNYQARNNLRKMKKGNHVLFYHSVGPREVVGIAEVTEEAFPEPGDDSGKWSVVRLEPRESFPEPVTLATIKAEPSLADIALIKQSRLSVMPLTASEFKKICRMGGLARK
ncbi:MAG: EVE domain-containing protein [Opitutales bacterium]|nr:EVE domain-containing protein [Opitutales bacterium]MCH8539935.1 EVE domain-containing protein [Opitutales bacterium]